MSTIVDRGNFSCFNYLVFNADINDNFYMVKYLAGVTENQIYAKHLVLLEAIHEVFGADLEQLVKENPKLTECIRKQNGFEENRFDHKF